MLGEIGEWAASCIGGQGRSGASGAAPSLSYRADAFSPGADSVLRWREEARETLAESLLMPELGPVREAAAASVKTARAYELDGVRIEELSWQLPHGAATKALFLTPASRAEGDRERLPAVLALHCHGGQRVPGAAQMEALQPRAACSCGSARVAAPPWHASSSR